MDNSHIEAILANGKRCLEIFFGERPEEECLQCPYKDKGICMEDIVNEFNNGARCERKKIEAQQH